MAKYRIRYTQEAIDDLDGIFDYVATANHDAAYGMLEKFEHSIARLTDLPKVGVAVHGEEPGIVSTGYRYITVDPYLVFYRIYKDEVRIGRILHSRQDWMHLLFKPRLSSE